MKRTVFKITLFVLTGVQIIPAQAMWTTAARAALRPNILRTGTGYSPATLVGARLTESDSLRPQPGPTLLVRTLASKHGQDYSGYNRDEQKAGSDSNSSDSNGYNWRSLFSQADKAQILGGTILGWHLWWSSSDICQTAEDFNDPAKLQRTKECYTNGNKNLVFDTFIRNFNDIKKNPEALQRVWEFFCTTFDYFKTDTSRMAKLIDIIVNEQSLLEQNLWREKLLAKIAKEPSYLQDALTIHKLFAQSSTQSAQHFITLSNANFKKTAHFSKSQDCKCLPKIVQTVLTIEKEEQDKGNYTFVHTYHWGVHFFQDIDAHLRNIAYDGYKQPLSLRFNAAPARKNSNKYDTIRKDIISRGVRQYYAYDDNKQKHMIFMNYALFAGFNEDFGQNPFFQTVCLNPYLSNALYFFMQNYSEQKPTLCVEKIAKHLNLLAYFKRYEKEFVELRILHDTASEYGAGIIFSFTPEMLRESVYVSTPGGGKRKVVIDGIGKTDDVKLILDTLRTAPEKIKDLDRLEFVFVVTKDCALNPRVQEADAYKVIPFNAADPEKMALYEQKRDELMAKIKADIEAERAAQTPAEKAQHEKKIAGMMTWYATHSCLEGCKESRVQENV